jgi:2-polyprenyl-6-hydroxyphenyl methylase/3-demethylubiquinone-9 3-methyltransferase
MTNKSTVSEDEIKKFEAMAIEWWDPYGKFKPLHDLAPLRLEYIINSAKKHFQLPNLKVLDIGCGGGLVSEPLARLGIDVTAIDASKVNIDIAKKHAVDMGVKVNYQNILAEDLAESGQKFQLIMALEILEHVENLELFIASCKKLLAPKGLIIFSTINRTIESFLKAIIGAEYILKWLPIGTHDWRKFLKPAEICSYAKNLELLDIQGVSYSMLSGIWSFSKDIKNNYFISFLKK